MQYEDDDDGYGEEIEPDDSRLQGNDLANELENQLGNELNTELLQTNNNMLNTTNRTNSMSAAPLSPIKNKKKSHRRYISIARGMEMEMEENVGS